MSELFQHCGAAVRRLLRAVTALEKKAVRLQVPPLRGREWYELLRRKLLPQLDDDSFLVVAVVGGTNIGKSVIFNHLAGCRASATSPLASGTKHPVCLVPTDFSEGHDLAAIFEGFQLREWRSSEEALEESEAHWLFWQTSEELPGNLLVLDTPDIDSDAPVNWQRADHIRRCADVLIAVLTQQKYNDAAVKRFFRTAAAEDKAVLVVFNQCQLPDDEAYWPLWLETFCRETGIEPEIVYLAPNDRRAAEANRLPFFERRFPPSSAALISDAYATESPATESPATESPATESPATESPATEGAESLEKADAHSSGNTVSQRPAMTNDGAPLPEDGPRNLTADLSRLRFEEIKLRTLRGSLRQLLSEESGVPAWLREVENRSSIFATAAELLSAEKLARRDDWPALPNAVMVSELRQWWQQQRAGWSKRVHEFYNNVGQSILWPLRYATRRLKPEAPPPLEQYRQREWQAIFRIVEDIYERLTVLSEAGNSVLQSRLRGLLAGETRQQVLNDLQRQHQQIDLEEELRRVVRNEMRSFREENPKMYGFLRKLDKTAAVVRPATSVVLFLTGMGPAGDAVSHLAVDSAVQTVVHVAGDITGGTVAAAVGDQALSGTAATGLSYIEAKFRQLHAAFIGQRLQWLLQCLRDKLWGNLLEEIHASATMASSAEYHEVQEAVAELSRLMTAPEHIGV